MENPSNEVKKVRFLRAKGAYNRGAEATFRKIEADVMIAKGLCAAVFDGDTIVRKGALDRAVKK